MNDIIEEKNYSNGESIFKKYNGSYYAMSLNGDLEKYKELNIEKHIEKKWLEEKKYELLKKLMLDEYNHSAFFRLCKMLIREIDLDIYDKLISIINKKTTVLNDINKLLISEQIIKIGKKYIKKEQLEEFAKNEQLEKYLTVFDRSLLLSKRFINSILESKILNIPCEYLDGSKSSNLNESKIRKRAKIANLEIQNIIQELKQELDSCIYDLTIDNKNIRINSNCNSISTYGYTFKDIVSYMKKLYIYEDKNVDNKYIKKFSIDIGERIDVFTVSDVFTIPDVRRISNQPKLKPKSNRRKARKSDKNQEQLIGARVDPVIIKQAVKGISTISPVINVVDVSCEYFNNNFDKAFFTTIEDKNGTKEMNAKKRSFYMK